MRTITRLGAGTAVLLALVLGWRLGSAQAADGVPIRTGLVVYEADAEQVQMARWAANRFELAGLQVPQAQVHFHRDLSGCHGHLGYALGGRVDLCTDLVDSPTRRALLHELGHIWLDEHFPASERSRFLRLRNLSAWNSSNDPWNYRGYEQGAEVMAWALGGADPDTIDPGQRAEEARDRVPDAHERRDTRSTVSLIQTIELARRVRGPRTTIRPPVRRAALAW